MQTDEKQVTPTLTVSQALDRGYADHCQGNLAEAERLYDVILKIEPGHADALHLKGMIRKQQGRHEEALALIGQALAVDQDYVEAHVNLGLTLCDLGRYEDALASYRAAAAIDPDYPEAQYNMGHALTSLGRGEEAIAYYRRAVELKPEYVEAHHNLALILNGLGRHDEAMAGISQALALKPDYVKGHALLGGILSHAGRHAEAEASYRRAVAIAPGLVDLHVGLGNALSALGRLVEAEESHRRALSHKPDCVEAHAGLGEVLRRQGRLSEAEASFRQVLAIRPDADAHVQLALVLRKGVKLIEALASLQRAIAIRSDHAEAHGNLGNVLHELGRITEAEAAYRRALDLRPDLVEAHTNLIFLLDFKGTVDTVQQQAERREWYQRHGRQHAAAIKPHENSPDPDRPLRIGYVSADFRRHSAYYAISPVILRHDRPQFEAICYSGVEHEDDATTRIRQGVAVWRSTVGVSDDALAEQIRHDRVDILVDLSGHSAGNRLLVFARKPAPVQVTGWGHATGTGVRTIDYFFADPVLVPATDRGLYAEEVLDLPCCFCYEPPEYLPAVAPLPALAGKPFTFGCLNRTEKISNHAIALWSRILARAPEAVLLLKGKELNDADLRQDLMRRLQAAGIAPGRLRLAGNSSHVEHLRAHNDVDLGLDPMPQSGGISTAEALWMGVPVVTLPEATPASRATASILTGLDWQQWIARTEEDYVRIATEAAADLRRLADNRMQLRSRLAASNFGDAQRYTRAVESAYRRMWKRWCGERAVVNPSR